ncbi:hypothetical protein [Pseudomonas knackmussii]|uniref:hypothetical protein n=1 Tax=Pseudomonas knackmussii TaxID=65741 RepID=UPI003F49DE4F
MNGHESPTDPRGRLLLAGFALALLLGGVYPSAPAQPVETLTPMPFAAAAPASREQWAAPAENIGSQASANPPRLERWVF